MFLQRHTCSYGSMSFLDEVCFRVNRRLSSAANWVLSSEEVCYWQRPRSECPPYGGLDFDFDAWLSLCRRLEPEKYRPGFYELRYWIRCRCVGAGSYILNLTSGFGFWYWVNLEGKRFARRVRRWRRANAKVT